MSTSAVLAISLMAISPQLDLKVWKPLTSFRPPEAVQKKVRGLGSNWKVQRIENAESYLNLDYYSIRVTELPTVDGKKLSRDVLFTRFKRYLVDTKRPSAKKVEFTIEPNKKLVAGTMLRLRFKPHTVTDCKALAYCSDIKWLENDSTCKAIDGAVKSLLGQTSFDDAYIVVAFSSKRAMRVSTVQGGSGLSTLTAKSTGRHPVSGNREFGYTPKDDGMIIYTIGSDRLEGKAPPMTDYAATFGYCSAEIFWRQFLNEFEQWINGNGGAAKKGRSERKMLEWKQVKKDKIWDPTGQPAWVN